MGREVWGTFSVIDHLQSSAFISDVMLYDRLVIPIPPDDTERQRWERQGWNPRRLDSVLRILGERAYPVKWDLQRREDWATRYRAASGIANQVGDWAFAATRMELTQGLPRFVTGVEAVVSYPTIEKLQEELELGAYQTQVGEYGSAVAAVIGREFLVPNNPDRPYEDLLKEAVELSSDPKMKYKREGFWRWQREFVDDKGMTDQSSVLEAVKQMHDMLEDERAYVQTKHVQTGIQYAYVVASVVLGLLISPLAAVSLGGAFLSVGKFASSRLGQENDAERKAKVALVCDVQKHFGWQ